ncbi:MAG: hypothetical protein U0414_03555 [Polyangiaceae bacterium]
MFVSRRAPPAPGSCWARRSQRESSTARADAGKKPAECPVAHARVRLADVYPGAPSELAGLDLGPSPLVGSSRLITRAEIVAAVPAGTTLPATVGTVRVVRKTSTISVATLEKLTTDALAGTPIPKAGTVLAVRPSGAATVPDGWETVEASLAKVPRKAGKVTISASLRFLEGDSVVSTATIPVDLTLPESAAIPDAKRGSSALLVVKRGSVEIRAAVTVGADADVGDEVTLTVKDTGHVVRGKLVQSDPPMLDEVP